MSRVYYNEFDRRKAAALRNLIDDGVIAAGDVDERSIADVQPDDLAGYAQHHFFAGVGIWSLCLRNAGWPDDRPVWTGSCPCGPFSRAGLGKGFADPRHLWPEWFRLIRECRPDVVFGEQSADAIRWLDLVSGDLEGDGFAFGAADIPAAGFSAGAHLRQRFGFVADAGNAQWWSERAPWHDGQWPKTGRVPVRLGNTHGDGSSTLGGNDGQVRSLPETQRKPELGSALLGGSSAALSLADANSERLDGLEARAGETGRGQSAHDSRQPGGLADTHGVLWDRSRTNPGANPQRSDSLSHIRAPGLLGGARVDWLFGRDGRWRPSEPGLSPVADAYPERVGQLHCYGDAIDVEAFTNLIGAYLDAAPGRLAA